MGSGQTSAAAVARTAGRQPHVTFGTFSFDPNSRILRKGTAEIPLPPRVLGVLEVLLERAGDVVPRQELIDRVWKDAFVTDTSLAEAVSVLRQTLGDDPQSPTFIQTVHRRGYRFVAPTGAREPEPRARSIAASPAAAVEVESTPDGVSPSIAGQLVPWSAAAICAIAAAIAVWQLTHAGQSRPPSVQFAMTAAPGTIFDTRAPALALAPDGRTAAWSACDDGGCRLYVRPLDRLDAQPLARTDGAQMPFFSPDGGWIGFFADGRLKKVALAGGAPVTLADAPDPRGGAWSGDRIVFAPAAFSGLMSMPAAGGDPQPLTTPRRGAGEIRHAWPSAIPSKPLLLFVVQRTTGAAAGGDVSVLSIDAGAHPPWQTLFAADAARAAAPDVVVFSRGADLQAVTFDALRQSTTGEPRTLVSGVGRAGGAAQFALSGTGALIYAPASTAPAPFAWLDTPASSPVDAGRDIAPLHDGALSPDGARLAGIGEANGRDDVWVADIERGAATRITHEGVNAAPVWSADGRTIYFASRADGAFGIWSRRADAGDRATPVMQGDRSMFPAAAAPDGGSIAVVKIDEKTRADIWISAIDGRHARAIVAGPFDEAAPAFSPDSRRLAYQSAESGRWEIYVRSLADGDGAERTLVSTEGGTRPFWSKDGRFLYFESWPRLMRAEVSQTAGAVRAGAPVVAGRLDGGRALGIAPSGRILIERGTPGSTQAVAGLEWLRDARQLLGPPSAVMPR